MKPKQQQHGSRLKQIRRELNLTQVEIAEKLGISQATWAMAEGNKNALSNSIRRMLIDILGVNQAFIDKGTLPIKSAAKTNAQQQNGGAANHEEVNSLRAQIKDLQAVIQDKIKIIELYEKIKG